MSVNVAKNEMDLTSGKILKKLLILALPLLATNLLQLFFNIMDVAILGIFVNDTAVAAVGVNAPLINLFVNLFVGFSVGSNVVLSRCVGRNDKEKAHKVVGTSVILSLITGVLVAVIGVVFSETFLIWMQCDKEILDLAVIYMRIYFIGMPVTMFYNFAAAMLRAVGDTTRPMLFLLIAGIVNVGLNIFFILVLNMTVDGVAYATIISQLIASVLCFIVILKSKGFCRLKRGFVKIFGAELKDIIKIGLPSGIQSSLFSISNVLISSSVNSLGKIATTANAVSTQFDSFVWTAINSVAYASMSFVSQNYGADKFKRIKKVVLYSMGLATVVSVIFGYTAIFLSSKLFSIMTDNAEVIKLGQIRLFILCSDYFVDAYMDIYNYGLRAIGRSTTSMVTSIGCICVFRVIWLVTVFVAVPEFYIIFISYPISWILNIAISAPIFYSCLRKDENKLLKERQLKEESQKEKEVTEIPVI